MTWLKTVEERAGSLEDPNTPIAKALMFLGDLHPTITGRAMNAGTALTLAAVWNAVTIIAGDIATIPLKVYRRTPGSREEEDGHPLSELFALSPYPMVTSAAWRDASEGHLLLRGNCYSEIISNRRGEITGLFPFNPNNVQRKGEVYEILGKADGGTRRVHASAMLHIAGPGGNGVDGWSAITLMRQNLSLYQALEESNTRFVANAARPTGFLSHPGALTPEGAARAKKQFSDQNAGLDNVGNVPILDGEWSWQQVGLTAEDTQYIDSRKMSVTDVARWFNIPPHKIGDLERATFSNIDEQDLDYVKSTLRPWVVRWEQAMNSKLLTDTERRQGLFIAFNLEGLLRGDLKTRTEAYKSQIESGILKPNEARALEHRPPVEGGDRAYIRLDIGPLEMAGEIPRVGDERAEKRSVERRDHTARLDLRASFGALFLDSAGRMVRGEMRNVRRLLQRVSAEALRAAIEAYYIEQHADFAADVMGPVFRSYSEAMAALAAAEVDDDVRLDVSTYSDLYTETFADRYSAQSRRALSSLDAEQVEQTLTEWAGGASNTRARHEQVASREVVRLGEAVARATFVASGVATLIWRTIGGSCPYCRRLNGRIVSRTTPFLFKGDELEGEADETLTVSSDVHHAPAHRGCDCTIVPGS